MIAKGPKNAILIIFSLKMLIKEQMILVNKKYLNNY